MAGTLVVGTDGSPSAQLAVERAVRIARVRGDDLVVVHAYRDRSGGDGPLAGQRDEGGVRGRAILAAVRQRYTTVSATTVLCLGDPSAALADSAIRAEADTVVVGNRGMGSVRSRLLGSTTHRLSHRPPADLLIVHSTDGLHDEALSPTGGLPAYERIIVGVDGSTTATSALVVAATWAAAFEVELLITTVDANTDRAHAVLDAATVTARERGTEPKTHVVASGSPAAGLCETARTHGAQLIVVGNVGMSSTARRLGGCVPDQVSHAAPCDVLVVRTAR